MGPAKPIRPRELKGEDAPVLTKAGTKPYRTLVIEVK